MKLPDFLGLGAPRSGSTWLLRGLEQHPRVFVPAMRKEVHFFDANWHRGVEWYSRFFDGLDPSGICGEFTPSYLSNELAPQRIRSVVPNSRFLVILRDPVGRAHSQWKYRLQKRGERRPFVEYVLEETEPRLLGSYGTHLQRYLDVFPRDQFCILIFEEVVASPETAFPSVLEFLGVPDAQNWVPPMAANTNASFLPRYARLYQRAFRIKQSLRHAGFDRLVTVAKRAGIERAFGRGSPPPKLNEADRARVSPLFQEEVDRTEAILGRRIERWARPGSAT